jgi:hypothetical protein
MSKAYNRLIDCIEDNRVSWGSPIYAEWTDADHVLDTYKVAAGELDEGEYELLGQILKAVATGMQEMAPGVFIQIYVVKPPSIAICGDGTYIKATAIDADGDEYKLCAEAQWKMK